jgi:uncharacterized protein
MMRGSSRYILLRQFSVYAAWVLAAACIGCSNNPEALQNPTAVQLEALGLRAGAGQQSAALEELVRWSEKGNPVAQREAGLALALHRSAPHHAAGLSWLRSASAGGDAEAALILGEASLGGAMGVQQDTSTAAKYFEIAAEHGDAKAALMLARMLKNGDGLPRSAVLAGQWLQKSAEGGNPQAMFLLSNAYVAGDGFSKSDEKAAYWLEAAVDKHYPPAVQAMAQAVEGGHLGFKRDPQLVSELWKEAAEESRMRWKTQ